MSYQYDYAADSNGYVVGLRNGYDQGHAAGYVDGHNDTNARWRKQVTEQWEPLVDRLTAERDEAIRARDEAIRARDDLLAQVRHAGQQTHKWQKSFYSLLCALDSAMSVLQRAPQEMRTEMMVDYAKRTEYMKGKGWIDSLPQENGVVRSRARKTADQLQGWWNQVVSIAKKVADQEKNPVPGETP